MDTNEFNHLDPKILYFDNGATTFKPKSVIDATVDYYTNYSASVHRGDYDLSLKVDLAYEKTRELVKHLINAKHKEEIIFNSGTTQGMDLIVNGFFKNVLKAGDEVLITKTEHAANVLPWYRLQEEIGIIVKFIPLTDDYGVTVDNLKQSITNKTKIVSLAHITNVIGDVRPISEVSPYLHELGIYLVVDAAQSVAHTKVDVQEVGADFLVFSGHKMYGPTGVGILYGKRPLLEKMDPVMGGGMNDDFDDEGHYTLKALPYRLEAGTPNIAGVIGLGKAVEFILKTGINKIAGYEKDLRDYAILKLKSLNHIEIYNDTKDRTNIIFNVKGVFAQDTAIYLNQFGICVRAGSHCAKIIPKFTNIKNTCRISFGVYNTKKEIDYLYKALAAAADDVYKNIV